MGERVCYREYCPNCDAQVTIADEKCPDCDTDLHHGTERPTTGNGQ